MSTAGAIISAAAGVFAFVTQAADDKTDPVEVAFNGFPEIRTHTITCSENEIYEVSYGFGAPEGIDMRGEGVTLEGFSRSSGEITDEMKAAVAAELGKFASINAATFRCGWRQAIPEKESGSYLRMEFAGLRNCLTAAEKKRLEEVGSIEQTTFARFIEIRPTSVAIEDDGSEECAPESDDESKKEQD